MSQPVIIVIQGKDDFSAVAKEVQDSLGGMSKSTLDVSGAFTALGGVATQVWGGIKTTISAVVDTISTVAKVGGIAFTAMGAAGTLALTDIVSAGATFEQSMAAVGAVTGSTKEQIAEMSDVAREMGNKTVFGADQAAQAMYYLGSAGYDANQTIGALDGVLNLAGATMADLAMTSETVVSTVTAFGLKAEDATRISNVFAAAISGSQLEMNNLAEGMKYIAPVAGTLGISLEETTAALAEMSNAGFKGSVAGAALRNIFTDLLAPTDVAEEILNKYNLTARETENTLLSEADALRYLQKEHLIHSDILGIVNGDMKVQQKLLEKFPNDFYALNAAFGEGGTVGLLRKAAELTKTNNDGLIAQIEATQGLAAGTLDFNHVLDIFNELTQVGNSNLTSISPTTKTFTEILRTLEEAGMSAGEIMQVFGERGGPQLMALLNQGSDALTQMTADITGTNSAAEQMAIQTDTVQGKWNLLKNAFNDVSLSIYEVLKPAIKSVLDWVTDVVWKIGDWVKSNAGIVTWSTVIITAISIIMGPILLLISTFTGLTLAMIALAPVFAPLFGLFGLLAAAVLSIIEVVKQADIDWTDAWEHVKEVAEYVWGSIKDIFYDVIDNWFPSFKAAGNDFADWWQENHEQLFQTAMDKWDEIVIWIKDALDTLHEYWKDIIGPALEGDWETVWENIKSLSQTALNSLIESLKAWWDEITPKMIQWVSDFIIALAPSFVDAGIAFAGAMWNGFWSWWSNNWRESFENTGWSDVFGGSSGTGSGTNLPEQGDEWDFGYHSGDGGGFKRSSAPGGNTSNMTVNASFNISGTSNPEQTAREVWYHLQNLMRKGAIA